MNKKKLLKKILSGSKNIRFQDMIVLVQAFGFDHVRTQGSHHIFAHPQISELVNLQNVKGQTKPYQIRQFLRLVEKYDLVIKE